VSQTIPIPDENFIVSESIADQIDMTQFGGDASVTRDVACRLHFVNAEIPSVLQFIQMKDEKPVKIIVRVDTAQVINTILTDTFQAISIELEDSSIKKYDCTGQASISTEVAGRAILLEIGFPPDSLVITG